MVLEEKFTLSNGVEIPKLGFGTWLISNHHVKDAVVEAAKVGYRHIDTALAYHNESGVGEGIRASGVKREEMFVTSKVAAEIKDYKEAASSIDKSLRVLKFDYIDLMIIHSPKPWAEFHGREHYFEGNREVWRAMEEGYNAGKLRAIGVSNFEKVDIENILASCSVKPMVNQILAHAGNIPQDLIAFSKANNILVEAYSPIGHGKLLKNRKLAQVASRYNVSVSQLCIRFVLQLGLLPLPKTTNPSHMKNDAEVDFVISEEDMQDLLSM